MERDWLGHGIQFAGILLIVGVPLMYFGNAISLKVAVLESSVMRHEADIAAQHQAQVLISSQLTEANRQLTRIDTQLSDFLGRNKK